MQDRLSDLYKSETLRGLHAPRGHWEEKRNDKTRFYHGRRDGRDAGTAVRLREPTKTDYATQLEGTWTNGPAPTMVTTQQGEISGMRTVTAEIMRDGVNKGSFSVTVSDTVAGLDMPIVSKASGTMEVDETKITVTLSADSIELPPGVTPTPEQLMALTPAAELEYDLTDNDTKLDLSGGALVALSVTSSPTAKFTLTKEMASGT